MNNGRRDDAEEVFGIANKAGAAGVRRGGNGGQRFLVMAAGGCLQGAVGFGSNLVAAPLLLLVDEAYVPVAVVVGSLVLNGLMILREHAGHFDPTIKPAMVSQVPGAVVAGLVITSLPQRQLSLLFAALVLIGSLWVDRLGGNVMSPAPARNASYGAAGAAD